MRSLSVPIGKIFGADLRVHATFILLLLFLVVREVQAGADAGRAMCLAGILLGAALAHELAHIAVAALSGSGPRLVLLLPIGGISFGFALEAETVDAQRWQREVRIALAGPALSLALAFGAGLLLAAIEPTVQLWQRPVVQAGQLLRSFLWINLALGAVNLLPAYPL